MLDYTATTQLPHPLRSHRDRFFKFKRPSSDEPGMLKALGVAGVVGFLLLTGGIALLAYVDLLIGGGVAAVIAGLGMVLYGLISNLLGKMGMGLGDF